MNTIGIAPYSQLVHLAAENGGSDELLMETAARGYLVGLEVAKKKALICAPFVIGGTILAFVCVSVAAKKHKEKECAMPVDGENPAKEVLQSAFESVKSAYFENLMDSSMIFRSVKNQDALRLMKSIIRDDVLVNVDLDEVIRLERQAVRDQKEVHTEYEICNGQPDQALLMKSWAEKHPDAHEVLLFVEGSLLTGNMMANVLQNGLQEDSEIIFGVKEGKSGCDRVVGIFL